MARIDVTELLHDTDFVDNMIHVSRTSSVNSKGETLTTECNKETVGSIQPASGKAISRLPDELRQGNVMSFWMQGTIVTTSPGKYPDILIFAGSRFQVQMVFDWTAWGQGWCEGLCVAESFI